MNTKMPKKKTQLEKLTVFGLFFKALGKYPWLTFGATATNVAALAIFTLIPWYYKRLFDALSSGGPKEQVAATAIGFVFIIAILNGSRWAIRRVSEYLISSLQPKFMQDMTLACFSHILKQPYQFFSDNFSGVLVRRVQRLSHGIMAIHDTLHFSITSMVITVAGSLLMVGMSSPTLAGIFGLWIAATLVFNLFFSKKLRLLRLKRAAKDSEVSGVIADAISNSTNIKLFSSEKYEVNMLDKVAGEWRNLLKTSWNLQNDSVFSQILVLMAIEFVAIYWSVNSWLAGNMTLGDIVLVQSIILKLNDLVWNLNNTFKNFYEAYADSQEMVDIFNIPLDVIDARGAKKLLAQSGTVIFDNVQFNYNETRGILKNFSIKIMPKEKIALVGPSGAGKSTIVKLILRFYDVTGGTISIDGQDISKVTQDSLRNSIAMVPQEPILFHRSLMDNIRYGRRDATDAEVYEAAKKAHCHEFISNLAEGYQTMVGERGIKLSGGERQRVAIARAILKNAPILVLDEATSSLDSESELLIHEALQELMKNKTVIVIAHRLSTIMEMDRIAVVENGQVIDIGTHNELLERAGTYKKLWEIQAGGFIE